MSDKAQRVPSTVCPDCQGHATSTRLVAATSSTGQAWETPRPCSTCKGRGKLPGFVPPV